MTKSNYYLLFSCLLLTILLTGCLPKEQAKITNFEECIQAGNPAMESYPRQCRTKDGQTFTEVLTPEEQAKVNPPENKEPPEEFCGWSTKEVCEIDLDCALGGCSGQVCMAEGEDIITTCEMKACYEARKYGVTCQCANQECQWQKE